MGTVGIIICIVCFAVALTAIFGFIGYIINKVNKIETTSKDCFDEVKDICKNINYNLELIDSVMEENRKILENINKRI